MGTISSGSEPRFASSALWPWAGGGGKGSTLLFGLLPSSKQAKAALNLAAKANQLAEDMFSDERGKRKQKLGVLTAWEPPFVVVSMIFRSVAPLLRSHAWYGRLSVEGRTGTFSDIDRAAECNWTLLLEAGDFIEIN